MVAKSRNSEDERAPERKAISKHNWMSLGPIQEKSESAARGSRVIHRDSPRLKMPARNLWKS